MIKIILLDVDGVLLFPTGYRAALRATFNNFTGSHFYVPEETLSELEKRGISSEWDMAPLLLAFYWADILSRQSMQDLPLDVGSAAIEINRQLKVDAPNRLMIPEFEFVPGLYPSEAAYKAGCFSSIPMGLRKNLLTETRNVHAYSTMRIFQHFTLGSKLFTETYHLPAEIETESFLLKYDTSNINEEILAKLRQSNHYLAAFTARPSGPPREIEESTLGYAPEAELALELVGLSNIPLIAFGKLQYLAWRYGLEPAALVKPSPFQALAATLAAWTGEEWPALQAANLWRETGRLSDQFNQLPKSFELIVVEDTMGGLYSAHSAGEILKKAGLETTVHLIGLTSGNSAKADAFENAGVSYYQDWESLVKGIGLL